METGFGVISHKVVHSKGCTRLMSTRVHQLLFCYVNLHLINRCNKEKEANPNATVGPDATIDEEMENFLGQALLEEGNEDASE